MTIEHLVISGGCIWGLYEYGVFKQLHKQEFWNINNIKTMYTTSAGAIVGTVLALKIDYETMDTYLIDRPWNKVWKESSYHVLDAFNKCGIFHKQSFIEMFLPLFKSIDIDINITMLEFYEKTNIDIHIFITELNVFESIEISHSSHPEWKLIDAIYTSCTLPAIFAPHMDGNKCYIDGGFFNNYPVKQCFMNVEDYDTILGICIEKNSGDENPMVITESSNILEFTAVLMNKLFKSMIFMNDNTGIIQYEIITSTIPTTIEQLEDISCSKEKRQDMIELGEEDGKKYYEKWNIPKL